MINIAVLGYGVVGSGVAEVVRKNANSIGMRAGEEIRVAKILDIRDFPEGPDSALFTKNQEDVFGDPSISIVVETIGGTGISLEFTKRAFTSGKHVVTSNKEIIAAHGPELLKMAADNNVNYYFEASVGGGIPIIRPMYQCLAANEIIGIKGILNGTTNYILTKMKNEGMDFSEALKGAQENGYAEANPSADIEGHDTCRKIAILSSIAFNEYVDYKGIHTEGITRITAMDIKYAERMGSVIRLVATSRKVGNKISARVSPAMVGKHNTLANVEDVFNAIVIKGDAIGDAMFYGRGAGKLPTASAVVADVIDIVKHPENSGKILWEKKDANNLLDFAESRTRYFVRVLTDDADSTQKAVIENFGGVEFVLLGSPSGQGEIAFASAEASEGSLAEAVEKLKKAPSVKGIANVIRIEGE